jgi:predicted enzyme related to lactoylglutathione lyase
MSDTPDENSTDATPAAKPANIGRVEWLDLTVEDAGRVRNFYKAVVGWSSSDVPMGSYDDYCMNMPGTQDTVAGICHARGVNSQLPSQWLIYVRVASVADSVAQCEKLGGRVLQAPRRMAGTNFCVIQDPAGAVMALMSD